jgi:hypothetical protein
MLLISKRRYKKQHVIGGAGIFDTVSSLLKRLITSNPVKSIASKLASSAVEVGKSALFKAIDIGKEKAIKAVSKPPALTPANRELLKRLTNPEGTVSIQDLVKGSGLRLA